MSGYSYTLILEEPILANSQSGDANSARSLPFIPGGLMRGAFINTYLGGNKVDAEDEKFQRLFLNGSVRYLHAYPENKGLRALPTPLSWKTFKHVDEDKEKPKIFNFAVKSRTDPDIKSVPFELYWLNEGIVSGLKSEYRINVHTQRDAIYGRAMGDGQGAVYRYEALPAGLRLQGIVLADTTEDLSQVEKMLQAGKILLGKARSAGYGSARIVDVKKLDENWRENSFTEKPTGGANRFTVEFLSDTLVRDPAGQYSLDPLPALSEKLGCALKASPAGIFRRVETLGGFNRSWGLHLPQAQAIAAGSVLVIEADSEISNEKFAALESDGIGERMAEGFGRLAVWISAPADFDWEKIKNDLSNSVEKITPTGADRTVANVMLARLLRRDLDEKLMTAALGAIKSYQAGSVPNSQLSRWRVILRSVLGQQDDLEKKQKRLRDFYAKESKRNSAAWQKMERAKVTVGKESSRLSDWINGLLQSPETIWEMLHYRQAPIKKIGTFSLQADKNFEFEYALRLMDAILASLAKKNAEKER